MKRSMSSVAVARLRKILKKVNAWKPKMEALSDQQLSRETAKFRALLNEGKTLDDILPEAFAAIREAAKRVLGMSPYDVQVMGAIALHQGKIIEMKTGEGKTLVAVMALYLNALSGKGAILVTMNSYLAVRDGTQMSRLFHFMQLTLDIGVNERGTRMSNARKKSIYACDIVYTTSSALGFDYLLDNLVSKPSDRYMRPFNYVIIDEADSVLLDMAMMPLIISGAPRVKSNLFRTADDFVSFLHEDEDYEVEDKNVWLTEQGIKKAEQYFRYSNLFSESHIGMMRHISLALRARCVLHENEDYVVSDGKIQLLDAKTGRILKSNKLEAGLHQALEAKEHVAITKENRSMASITYQSLFNLFPKASGMTGTGVHDVDEFRMIYGMDVVVIPTNKPVRRKDYPDRVFATHEESIQAVVDEVLRLHAYGQPVLVVCNSIDMSNAVSEKLLDQKIPHNMLNAYNTAKESEIVGEAGRLEAVTIATAVAGRGTDIKLPKEVKERGGLAVLGLGRMASRREELQVRGRAGRQGDPGFSRFYVSPEDQVVQEYGSDWIRGFDSKHGINSAFVKHAILRSQRICEERGRSSREQLTRFDESLAYQRNIIYETRRLFMDRCTDDVSYYMEIEKKVLDVFEREYTGKLTDRILMRYILENISYRLDEEDRPALGLGEHMTETKEYLLRLTEKVLRKKLEGLSSSAQRKNFLRRMTLRAIDDAWIREIDFLQQLRQSVSGRQFAGRNVMQEYYQESYYAYQRMTDDIHQAMMRNILLGEIERRADGKINAVLP